MADGKTKESASNGYKYFLNLIHLSFLHTCNLDLLVSLTNILTLPQGYHHKCNVLYSSIKKLNQLVVTKI